MKNSIILFVILFSSSSAMHAQMPLELGPEKFSMSKSPCFGKCPQFDLLVYKDKVVFEGKSNTDKDGVFIRDLSKAEFKMIKKAFKKARVPKGVNDLQSYVSDAQYVTLTQNKGSKVRSVKGSIDRPKAFIDLEKIMDQVANRGNWMRIKAEAEKQFPGNLIPNQMMIQLKQDVEMSEWIESYSAYGMVIDRSMVPNFNYMKVKFDLNAISSQDMLVKVRKDERVHSVSYVKKPKESSQE